MHVLIDVSKFLTVESVMRLSILLACLIAVSLSGCKTSQRNMTPIGAYMTAKEQTKPARAALERGDTMGAYALMQAAINRANADENANLEMRLRFELATIFKVAGRPNMAKRSLEETVVAAETQARPADVGLAYMMLAELALSQHRVSDVDALMRQAIAAFDQTSNHEMRAEARLYLAEQSKTLSPAGRRSLVQEAIDEIEFEQQRQDYIVRGAVLMASDAIRRKRYDEANDYLTEAEPTVSKEDGVGAKTRINFWVLKVDVAQHLEGGEARDRTWAEGAAALDASDGTYARVAVLSWFAEAILLDDYARLARAVARRAVAVAESFLPEERRREAAFAKFSKGAGVNFGAFQTFGPTIALPHIVLGDVAMDLDDFKGAVGAYEQALLFLPKLKPEGELVFGPKWLVMRPWTLRGEALRKTAAAYAATGDREKALKLLWEADFLAERDGDNLQSHLVDFDIAIVLGDFDSAKAIVAQNQSLERSGILISKDTKARMFLAIAELAKDRSPGSVAGYIRKAMLVKPVRRLTAIRVVEMAMADEPTLTQSAKFREPHAVMTKFLAERQEQTIEIAWGPLTR
ncbi:MAG: hypothetical protein RLO01_01105 [Thalassobaculaceae bacterium]